MTPNTDMLVSDVYLYFHFGDTMRLMKIEKGLMYALSGISSWIEVRKETGVFYGSGWFSTMFFGFFGAILVAIDCFAHKTLLQNFPVAKYIVLVPGMVLLFFLLTILGRILWMGLMLPLFFVNRNISANTHRIPNINATSMLVILLARILVIWSILLCFLFGLLSPLMFLGFPLGLYMVCVDRLSSHQLQKRQQKLRNSSGWF